MINQIQSIVSEFNQQFQVWNNSCWDRAGKEYPNYIYMSTGVKIPISPRKENVEKCMEEYPFQPKFSYSLPDNSSQVKAVSTAAKKAVFGET